MFPWEEIDREYSANFTSGEGQVALPSRLAFGALYIQTTEGYTDEKARENIQENPYLQYFCGFECYTLESRSRQWIIRTRTLPKIPQRKKKQTTEEP